MIKILSLKKRDGEEAVINFEEVMDIYGQWSNTNTSETDFHLIKELDYHSSEYSFYIGEAGSGEHTLYRVKKK